MRKNFAKYPSATSLEWGAKSFFIIGLVCLVYSRVVAYPFLSFDDLIHVQRNPLLAKTGFFSGLWEIWRGPYQGLYIPVTYSCWFVISTIQHSVFGTELNSAPFHLANILFHAANGILILRLLEKLGFSMLASFIAVLFFLFHPLQVETVVWVSGFRDTCMAFFALLSLVVLISASSERFGIWDVLVLLCGVLAVLAKPSAVILPLVWLVLDRSARGCFRKSTMWLVAMGLFISFLSFWMTRNLQPAEVVKWVPEFPQRMINVVSHFGFYVEKTLLPMNLAFRYSDGRALVGALSVILIAVTLLVKEIRVGAGLIIFVLALAPTLGFVPFFYQNFSPVADRYAYLALFGASLFLLEMIRSVSGRGVALVSYSGVVLLILMNISLQSFWRSDFALVERAATVAPSGQTVFNLASIRQAEWVKAHPGVEMPIALTETVEREYREAIQLDAHLPEPVVGLGVLLTQKKAYHEAERVLRRALQMAPSDRNAGDIYSSLALIFADTGRADEAEAFIQKAIEIDPGSAGHHANLGVLFEQRNLWGEALAQYKTAQELWRMPPDWLEGRINSVTEKLAQTTKSEATP